MLNRYRTKRIDTNTNRLTNVGRKDCDKLKIKTNLNCFLQNPYRKQKHSQTDKTKTKAKTKK